MEVLYLTFEEELETPLLLHKEAVLFQEEARKDGLTRLDAGVADFWQSRVNGIRDTPLSNFHRLGLTYNLSKAHLCHIAVPVDARKERVRLENLHVLSAKTLIWVQTD